MGYLPDDQKDQVKCAMQAAFSLEAEKGKKKESYESHLDYIVVSVRVNDRLFGDGVFVSMHSTQKPTKAILRKMAAKAANHIYKHYGFLMSDAKDKIWDFADNYKEI